MRIGQVREMLPAILKNRRRVLWVGPPGVGKTTAIQETCVELAWDCIVMCLPLDDPSTIRGYPRPPKDADGDAVHCLFDGMARAFRATRPTVVVYDDMGQATESTLKAVMRILQFGELDGRKLPDCVVQMGATNDVGHGAGVYGMIEPLKSRFHSIIQVETNLDDVIGYGLARHWPDWLLGFLRNSPESLNDWKPSKSMAIDGACPRGWEYLAEWDKIGIQDPEIWGGCVGKGQAASALAFSKLVNELPDIDALLIDPDSASVPENPSARFLVSMAIASHLNVGNFGNAIRYLKKLPQMFQAYSVRDAFRAETERKKAGTLPKDYRNIAQSRDFTAWACSQDGKDVMAAAS